MTTLDIITGFLGAGKTTFSNLLLNYYIRSGEQPVYIVNEFGKTGLDAEIMRHKGFKAYELSNGCICCSLKENTTAAIKEMLLGFSPTKIVFEPSGIFVFNNFLDILKEDDIKNKCIMGKIITIADSLNFKRTLTTAGSFFSNQLINAQQIVLSKLEKFSGDLADLICNIRLINQTANLIAKPWNLFADEDFEKLFPMNNETNIVNSHTHEHYKSYTFESDLNYDDERLEKLYNSVISGKLGNVYRVKGIIKKNNEPVLLNISFNDICLQPCRIYENSSITFIGSVLCKEKISDLLK